MVPTSMKGILTFLGWGASIIHRLKGVEKRIRTPFQRSHQPAMQGEVEDQPQSMKVYHSA